MEADGRWATTRAIIRPTVTHATRSSWRTAEPDACVASHAAWSSKSRVNPVRWFSDIGSNDVTSAGGKGANLGELFGAGLPVPDGFVVTADAYLDAPA